MPELHETLLIIAPPIADQKPLTVPFHTWLVDTTAQELVNGDAAVSYLSRVAHLRFLREKDAPVSIIDEAERLIGEAHECIRTTYPPHLADAVVSFRLDAVGLINSEGGWGHPTERVSHAICHLQRNGAHTSCIVATRASSAAANLFLSFAARRATPLSHFLWHVGHVMPVISSEPDDDLELTESSKAFELEHPEFEREYWELHLTELRETFLSHVPPHRRRKIAGRFHHLRDEEFTAKELRKLGLLQAVARTADNVRALRATVDRDTWEVIRNAEPVRCFLTTALLEEALASEIGAPVRLERNEKGQHVLSPFNTVSSDAIQSHAKSATLEALLRMELALR